MSLPIAKDGINGERAIHLEWIDVFRGIAALWVILFHSRIDLWVGFRQIHSAPGSYSIFDRLLAWLSLPAACGGGAVMLFFLISGFCVHLPYVSSNRSLNGLEYCLRRALRILPPYLFAIVFTYSLEWLAYFVGGPSPTSLSQLAKVASLTQNYSAHPHQLLTNGALWSLPVEVEFYIAYLFLYFLLKSTKARLVALFISAISLAATISYQRGISCFDQNFLRFWAIWCAGALLAEWFKRGNLPQFNLWNGVSLVLIAFSAMWAESHQWQLGLRAYLWAGAYFHVVWLALRNPASLYRLPESFVQLLVWLGTISYSAYLIHRPLFAFCGFLWTRFAGDKPASFLVPLFFSVLIWPVAWLFWKFCEYPFHQLSRRMVEIGPASAVFAKGSFGRKVLVR